MNITQAAAIDIGSNAVRLMISDIIETPSEVLFRKVTLVRIPLRLGDDVFVKGVIGNKKTERLIEACTGFSHLIKAHEIKHVEACATSAMREAGNSGDVIARIKKACGLDVRVISGEEEASVIYSAHMQKFLEENRSYIYVDIGGGSTEITLFENRKPVASRSFNIGTVRLLEKKVKESMWKEMKAWLKEETGTRKDIITIGSGGTINKLARMVPGGKGDGAIISRSDFRSVYEMLQPLSMEERIVNYNLPGDRADVIIPAAQIMLIVMKWASSKYITIPKFGLADGLIRRLYEEVLAEKPK